MAHEMEGVYARVLEGSLQVQEDPGEQNDMFPVVVSPVSDETRKELATIEEQAFSGADILIKLKPRESGFLVTYDGTEWQTFDALPPMKLEGADLYWGRFTGMEFEKLPLSETPEDGNWAKHGELTLYHPTYGEALFRLTPTAVRNFKNFVQSREKWGIDPFGKIIGISSRLAKTKAGFLVNIAKFRLVDEAMPAPAVNVPEEAEEDDVPF